MALPELGEGAADQDGYLVTIHAPDPKIKINEKKEDEPEEEKSES